MLQTVLLMQTPKYKHKSKEYVYILVALFLFIFFIEFCVPATSDDLLFACKSSLSFREIIRYVLYYGNGRFLGNLCSIVLSRFHVWAAFFKAFVLTVLLDRMAAFFSFRKTHRTISLCALFLLIFCMSPSLFSEVISWTSGFTNYITPMLLVMICIEFCTDEEKKKYCFPILILGFCCQFFVEHISIITVILSCAGMVWFAKQSKEKSKRFFFWLIGSLLGLIIMVLLPRLFYVPGNQTEQYGRGLRITSLFEMIDSVWRNTLGISKHLIQNSVIICCLSLILALFFSKDHKGYKRAAYMIVGCFCGGVSFFTMFLFGNEWNGSLTAERLILFFLILASLHVLFLPVAMRISDRNHRVKVIGTYVAAIISLAPLLIVTPLVNRCTAFYYFTISGSIIAVLTYYLDDRLDQFMLPLFFIAGTLMFCFWPSLIISDHGT